MVEFSCFPSLSIKFSQNLINIFPPLCFRQTILIHSLVPSNRCLRKWVNNETLNEWPSKMSQYQVIDFYQGLFSFASADKTSLQIRIFIGTSSPEAQKPLFMTIFNKKRNFSLPKFTLHLTWFALLLFTCFYLLYSAHVKFPWRVFLLQGHRTIFAPNNCSTSNADNSGKLEFIIFYQLKTLNVWKVFYQLFTWILCLKVIDLIIYTLKSDMAITLSTLKTTAYGNQLKCRALSNCYN